MEFTFNNNDSDEVLENDKFDFKINIRVQQRNGRKSWTIVEGLYNIENFNFKKTLKCLKKELCCNGSIKTSDIDSKKVMQFQGDHRKDIKEYLIIVKKVLEKNIIVHGF